MEINKELLATEPGDIIKLYSHGLQGDRKDTTVRVLTTEEFEQIVKDTIVVQKVFLHEPEKLDPDGKYNLPHDFIRDRFEKKALQQPYRPFKDLWDWPSITEAIDPVGTTEFKDDWQMPKPHLLYNAVIDVVHLLKVLRTDVTFIDTPAAKKPAKTDIQKFNELLDAVDYPISSVYQRLDCSKAERIEIVKAE